MHLWLQHLGAVREDSSILDEVERRRSLSFRDAAAARRYIRAHVMLRDVLSTYLGIHPAEIAVRQTARGKPFLDDPPPLGLHFNLSHSGDFAAVAVARTEVGVDIELRSDIADCDALAHEIMSTRELQAYATLASRDRLQAFFDLWAAKEAVLKAHGSGLLIDPRSVDLGLEVSRHRLGDRSIQAGPLRGIVWAPVIRHPALACAAAVRAPSIEVLSVPPSSPPHVRREP